MKTTASTNSLSLNLKLHVDNNYEMSNMRYLLLPFLAILVSFNCYSQEEISIGSVKRHVGDNVKVCTKIFGGKYMESVNGSPTFLNAGGEYPNAPFTIVIWGNNRDAFKNPPEQFYIDKDVCVIGKIVLHDGKPEIIVKSEDQIEIK